MLLNIERREVSTQGLKRVAQATIKASPKVFSFFNDLTYSNKPVAILRELVANGYDAHKMAGYDGPVEVYLPDEYDSTLRVVDHGIGMSQLFMLGDEDTPSQFMAYTDGSTKTGSNEQIGGFGIGSKSPFSYTDQFMIRSVHDGVASIYSIFKDETGVPGIGLLDEAQTDEGNGVEVIVPVDPKDHDAFRNAAQQALAYFDPRPEGIKAPEYASQGNGWAVRRTAGNLGVIMGGVRYEVDHYSLPYDLRSHALAQYGIDITVPIGTCQVALSRESLSMDNETLAAIKSSLDAVMDEITESFGTMFERYPTQWQAAVALRQEVKGNHVRSSLVTRHAKWRGQPLKTSFRVEGWTWLIQRGSRRAQNIPSPQYQHSNYIQPADIVAVVVVDDDKRVTAKIRHRFNADFQRDRKILVVKPEDLPMLKGPPTEIIHYTSQMELPPAAERQRYRPVPKLYDYNDNEIPEIGSRSIKVVMRAFVKPYPIHWDGLVDRNEVVFVNLKDADSVKHLPDFKEVYEQRKKAYLDEHGEFLNQCLAVQQALSRPFAFIARWRKELGDLTPAQKSRPFGKIVGLYDKYQIPNVPVRQHLLTPKMPPRIYPVTLYEQFEREQWQVNYLMRQNDGTATNIIKEIM